MRTLHFYTILLWVWLLAGAAIQLRAQTWDPDSPPEPGQISVSLTSVPSGCASFTQQWEGAHMIGGDATVTLTVTPNRDYDFVAWQDETGQTVSTAPTFRLTTSKNRKLTARLQFNPKDNPDEPGHSYYKVVATALPSNGGWIEQSGQGLYEIGKEVTITAHAYPDYLFSHWEKEGVRQGDTPALIFTMTKGHAYYTAVYRWNPASPSEPGVGMAWLYVENNLPAGGYVSQSGNGTYQLGSEVTVTASPYLGYQFVGWYANGQLLSSSLAYRFAIKQARLTLEARFAAQTTPSEPGSPSNPTVEIKPMGEAGNEAHGQIEVNGLAIPGQRIEVKAMPEEGYAFEGWYLNGQLVADAEMVYRLLVENDTKSLIAKFRELPFRLLCEGGEKGWAQVTRYRGLFAQLKAEPAEGYSFVGWFKGETLLSKEPIYIYDISGLRAALPEITAKFVLGTANELVEAPALATTARGEGWLLVTANQAIKRVEVYSYAGSRLATSPTALQAGACWRAVVAPHQRLLIVVYPAAGSPVVIKQ